MNKLNNFEVSSSSRWFPCIWRAKARKRHRLSLYGCLVFSSNVRQLIVWFLSRGSGKTAFLHPIGTSLCKAAKTVKFVICRTSTLCSFFLGYKTPWRLFCWDNPSTLPTRHGYTQVLIDPAGYCFRVRKSIWNLRLLYFSEWNQKPESLLLQISICWKNGQVSRLRLFRWEFPLPNWKLCVLLFQVPNPPSNVDRNAKLLSTCDPQHLPLYVPHPHLLLLIRFAFRVECSHVDVKRKILETLDKKVYIWS